MTTLDLSLELRKAIVDHLTANLTLIPAANIWGRTTPTNVVWPFVKIFTNVSTEPYEATCMDGSRCASTIHVFVGGDDDEPVELAVKEVVAVMESLVVPDLTLIVNNHTQKIVTIEGEEAGDYHAILNYDIVLVQVA